MKKKSVSSLHKKLWKIFSLYIRTRDCLRTTMTLDEGLCCTCNRKYNLKELQCGHFIPRSKHAIKYDERNNHAQCYGCNIMKKGNTVEYYEFMKKTHGQEVIDWLREHQNDICQWKKFQLEEKIEEYTSKLNNLHI